MAMHQSSINIIAFLGQFLKAPVMHMTSVDFTLENISSQNIFNAVNEQLIIGGPPETP